MVVSMIQVIFELPEATSLKEKRQTLRSLKDRLIRKYKVSVAEIDLQDSLSFCHIGAAYVTNSREIGERVMQRVADFVEDTIPGRVHNIAVHSERF
ncbi:DUF503 domain-containing protein [Marispirochaeta sp.]|jgi:uncharacterized protein|uniref:DUF503 domain-containing protein n=1 Tax=Marispirochaeta sp. TaxID=2038653 RepID=UPI0029C62967|nr:DUF503 domain-containing protein [Marispirochaeta sp.]